MKSTEACEGEGEYGDRSGGGECMDYVAAGDEGGTCGDYVVNEKDVGSIGEVRRSGGYMECGAGVVETEGGGTVSLGAVTAC